MKGAEMVHKQAQNKWIPHTETYFKRTLIGMEAMRTGIMLSQNVIQDWAEVKFPGIHRMFY